MKKRQDIKFRRGDHKELIFDIILSNDIDNLSDVEKIYWYVDENFISGETFQADDPILEKHKTDMTVETSTIEIDLITKETQSIKTGVYCHELKIKDAAGNVSTMARGRLRLY